MTTYVFSDWVSAFWHRVRRFLDIGVEDDTWYEPPPEVSDNEELVWMLPTSALMRLLETAVEVGKDGLDDVLIELWGRQTARGQMTIIPTDDGELSEFVVEQGD